MHRYRSIVVCTIIAIAATILGGGGSSSASTSAKPSTGFARAIAGFEASASATKPLFETVGIRCDGGTKPLSRTQRGSANFDLNDHTNSVSAHVKLQKADSDASYTVWLALTPNGPCGSAQSPAAKSVIKTNSKGEGSTKLSEGLKPGDRGAFVWLDTVASRDKIFSATYVFPNR